VVDLRRSAIVWVLNARERRRPPSDDGTRHRVAHLGRTLGLDPPPAPRLWTTPSQEAAAARLLADARPVLALAPTANAAVKVWPAARFAELAGRLTGPGTPLSGARIVVSGGAGEGVMAPAVLDVLPDGQGLDLVGLDPLTALYQVSMMETHLMGPIRPPGRSVAQRDAPIGAGASGKHRPDVHRALRRAERPHRRP
jgi:hypothetical protein